MNTTLLRTAITLLLLATPAGAQSNFWTPTSGPEGVAVGTFASYPPGYYFAQIFYDLYASSDAGASWRHVELNLAPSLPLSMTIDVAGFAFVGGTNGQILRSDDLGATWTRVSALPNGTAAWSLVVEEGGAMYASGLEKCFKSTDAGASWELIPFEFATGEEQDRLWVEWLIGLRPGSAIAMNYDVPYIVNPSRTRFRQTADTHALKWRQVTDIPGGAWYAATGRGVWRADDPRTNWTPTALDAGSIQAVAGTQRGDLVALRGAEVLLSRDGGAAWQSVPITALAAPPSFVYRLDADHVMLRTGTGLFVLNTVTEVIDPRNRAQVTGTVPALAEGPAGAVYAAAMGTYGRLYRTLDRGATWDLLPTSPHFTSTSALSARPNGTIIAVADTDIVVSRDGGATWRMRGRMPSSAPHLVAAPNGVVFAFSTADTVLLRSADDGETWSAVGFEQFGNKHLGDLAVMADGSALAATQDALYRSIDGGASWQSMAAPTFNGARIAITPEGAVYLLGPSSYRSTDGGGTWTRLALPATLPTAVAVLPGRRLYAALGNGGLVSYDDGATWRTVVADTGDHVIAALVAADGSLYGGTAGRGVLRHAGTSAVPRSAAVPGGEMTITVAPMPAGGRAPAAPVRCARRDGSRAAIRAARCGTRASGARSPRPSGRRLHAACRLRRRIRRRRIRGRRIRRRRILHLPDRGGARRRAVSQFGC